MNFSLGNQGITYLLEHNAYYFKLLISITYIYCKYSIQ